MTPAGNPEPAELITGFDHLEFWVGNARQTAYFLSRAFGFTVTAYAGPETGVADRASYVLDSGTVRLVVTGAMTPESSIAEHVRTHGDGVIDIALGVTDTRAAHRAAMARGATSVMAPWIDEDDRGKLVRATIATYGETRHTFVERAAYSGPFAPGYMPLETTAGPESESDMSTGPVVGLRALDHVVGNVGQGSLDRWVAFYRRVLGFEELVHFDDEQISTAYSALRSTVVWNGGSVVLPINEPADGRRRSQIEEYLDFYRAPGVQHVALATDDIVASVAALRQRGVRFLDVPAAYYDDVRARLGHLDLPWAALQQLGVLVDEDRDGYLLQIFTEHAGDRPTLFFEIIQRVGAKGFGAGNFKALFEAIERQQDRRGNL